MGEVLLVVLILEEVTEGQEGGGKSRLLQALVPRDEWALRCTAKTVTMPEVL